MVKKVIFIAGTKFGLRDYKRFGIEIIESRGYEVELWDFISWIKPNYYKKYRLPDPIDFDNIKIFTSRQETIKQLTSLNNENIVIDIFRIIELNKLKLSDNVLIGTINLAKIPQLYTNKPLSASKLLFSNPLKLVNKITNYINRLMLNNFSYNFLITDGKRSESIHKEKSFKKSKIINAHSFDYDSFLKENKKPKNKILDYNYAVFLDEAIFSHPDLDYLDIESAGKIEEVYYQELSNYFDKFEKEHNLEVIISLHPRLKKHDKFGKRKVYESNSINLVRNSNIVLLHASTSISFAILFYKPIVFLDSNNFNKDFSNTIKTMSNSIKVEPINISTKYSSSASYFKFNKENYDIYKSNYIKKSNTQEKLLWEIFCDYLDTLNV